MCKKEKDEGYIVVLDTEDGIVVPQSLLEKLYGFLFCDDTLNADEFKDLEKEFEGLLK